MLTNEEIMEQLESFVKPTIKVSEQALEIMATSSMSKSVATFIFNLYKDLKNIGFNNEQAFKIVQNFDTSHFLGKK
jgi:hypothetical protein